jgi:hypothetical protein
LNSPGDEKEKRGFEESSLNTLFADWILASVKRVGPTETISRVPARYQSAGLSNPDIGLESTGD